MLHRCQLAGRGFHMQWCSRVAFPVRRCAQLTWRDWKPWRPQVVVHGVHGLTRQWRAQASVEQFFRELGLPMETHIKEKEGGVLFVSRYINSRSHVVEWYLPQDSTAHPVRDFGGVSVAARNMSVLRGQTGTHALTVTLRDERLNPDYKQVLLFNPITLVALWQALKNAWG